MIGKNILLAAALCAGEMSMAIQFDGTLTDKLPGWSFKASKPKDGLVYNEFEGYYPDKGGKLSSAPIRIGERPSGSFYRVRFDAKAPERSYWGVDFFDASGKLLPDYYGVIHPGDRAGYEFIIYAMGKVDSMRVFFQSNRGIEAWNLSVEPATPEEAARWCDELYATLPPIDFKAAADSFQKLPRTAEALRTGKPWRVVFLGDSIMQDAFHSQFESLVKREFPKSNLDYIISMRGSTGCWFYRKPENFQSYVAAMKPDLLVIGGISNYQGKDKAADTAAILEVAERARKELGCEVLLLTGALSIDTRGKETAPRKWALEADKEVQKMNDFEHLYSGAAKLDIPVWDMTTPCYNWLYASGKPYEFHSRDYVHSGERGKQIIGRVLFEYFRTAQP